MAEKRSLRWLAAAGTVVLLGVVAYLPALDNPFISDDYAFLRYVQPLGEDWGHLADIPLGLRRATSLIFFYFCFLLFGLNPAPYYAASLLLHLVNTALVALLVRELTSDRRMALVAALFFVAYERHQEAVFWINSHHEMLVSAGVLATAIFFARFRRSGQRRYYGLALAAFAFSAISKESFVVIAPLLVLLDLCLPNQPQGRRWLAHAPFWLVSGASLVTMKLGPWVDPLYVISYGVTPHFFGVYPRALNRLLLFVYLFLFLTWLAQRWASRPASFRAVLRGKPLLFFAGWLLVALVPYSFVLYTDQLPSRHTYIPSVATAGLVAFLFVRGWEQAGRRGVRRVGLALLGLCLAGNVAYLWRKDGQYLARAAPTEQLIAVLNRNAAALAPPRVVVLYDFPQPFLVAKGAARFFTPVAPRQVRLRDSSEAEPPPAGSYRLRWNPDTRTLEALNEAR